MKEDDVPETWIGLMVRARIKTSRGRGEYLVLGRLADVDGEGIKIMAGSPSDEAPNREKARFYSWECVAGVEPLEP